MPSVQEGGEGSTLPTQGGTFWSGFRKLFAPYRGQNPQNWEKRFQSEKTRFPATPDKGVPSQKIPPFLYSTTGKWGGFFFDSERPPLFGVAGNGVCLTRKPSFPNFWDFDPWNGQTGS